MTHSNSEFKSDPAHAPRRSVTAGMEDADVPSPCISVCVLDRATGWCTGCLRTIEEIATWGNLDNPSRRAVIDQLPSRTRALKDRRHGND